MNTAKIIYEQVRNLPEPLAAEVLDFVGFLKEKTERTHITDLMNAQSASLEEVWSNDEDEVWNDQ